MGWYETCEYCGQQARYAILNCNCPEDHICTKLKLLKGQIVKKVDYDDVNHQVTDAMIETITEILNKNFDVELYLKKVRENELKRWNEEEEIREEHKDFEEYFNSMWH